MREKYYAQQAGGTLRRKHKSNSRLYSAKGKFNVALLNNCPRNKDITGQTNEIFD